MDTIIVKKEDINKRLDKFLAEKMSGVSRSQIKKKILACEIFVNGKKADVHKFLKERDEIQFANYKSSDSHYEESLFPVIARSPAIAGRRSNPLAISEIASSRVCGTRNDQNQAEPKIIFEDKDFLVIDKPSGMLVHIVGAIHESPLQPRDSTLVDWLIQKYPEIKNVGEEKYREGIIHRLDKDVSGVMLVAKTQKGFLHLKQQFKERKVTKKYLALVYGIPSDDAGKINLPIGRNEDGKFVAHPRINNLMLKEKDKHAITHYKLIESTRDYSLLEVQILTGRTHQIRAHLSAIGHPIVGDREYGPSKPFLKKFSKKIKVLQTPRIFLHSHTIGFYNLQNQWVEFESPLPQELEKFFLKLR